MQKNKQNLDHVLISTENGKVETWYVSTLWERATESNGIFYYAKVDDFNLDFNAWFSNGEEPTILNVLKHYDRMMNADLSYPVLLSPTGRILDGTHRIAKAYILKHQEIYAFRFNEMPCADVVDVC